MDDGRELAIKLLGDNREDIARGVHKLVCRLNTRWAAIDADAFAGNGTLLIKGVETFLQGGDIEVILKVAREILKVRKLSGFEAQDFLIVCQCYLPVIRHAFHGRAPSLAKGAAAYDAVESILLPLFTRIIHAVLTTASEITSPDTQAAFHGRPFERINVLDEVPEFMRGDDDTDPGIRRRPR